MLLARYSGVNKIRDYQSDQTVVSMQRTLFFLSRHSHFHWLPLTSFQQQQQQQKTPISYPVRAHKFEWFFYGNVKDFMCERLHEMGAVLKW